MSEERETGKVGHLIAWRVTCRYRLIVVNLTCVLNDVATSLVINSATFLIQLEKTIVLIQQSKNTGSK